MSRSTRPSDHHLARRQDDDVHPWRHRRGNRRRHPGPGPGQGAALILEVDGKEWDLFRPHRAGRPYPHHHQEG